MTLGVRGQDREGYATPATGIGGHTEGQGGSATGQYAHTEGSGTTALANHAHAEGQLTTASGTQSHAEGVTTTASGVASHAEGSGTVAGGNYSHASGSSTRASRLLQKSHGVYLGFSLSQVDTFVYGGQTNNATPRVLTADGATVNLSGNDISVMTLTVRSMFTFRIEACARRFDTQGEMAGFIITGVIGRDSTGNARIIGTPTTVGWADSGASTWTLTVGVDTSNATYNYLTITATGEASKTIAWVAGVYATNLGTSPT